MRSGPTRISPSLFDCEPYCHRLCPPDSRSSGQERGALCSVGEASGSRRGTDCGGGPLQRESRAPAATHGRQRFPGPNEPVDFDREPFITQGLSPSTGKPVRYYNFDVQSTTPAPVYVLYREGEKSRWWVSSTSSTASRARWGTTISDRFGRFSCPSIRSKFHRRRGDVA